MIIGVIVMIFQYKLSSTGGSSAKYGKCELCNKDVSEVFIQTKSKEFDRPEGTKGLAQINQTFGHENCLINVRR
jgi:hypothetical protein